MGIKDVKRNALNDLYDELNKNLPFPHGDYAEDLAVEVVGAIDAGANIEELKEVFERYLKERREAFDYIDEQLRKQEEERQQVRISRKGLLKILSIFD